MVVEQLNGRHARVKLPKLGWVRFRLSRPLDGALIRSATLTRDGAHWYVSFLVDDGQSTPDVHAAPGTAVGVDRGVVVAVATSDGRLVNRDFLTDGERRRGLRLQRRLSRAAKHSRNRAKTREALGVIRARERRRRQDFCARTARELATNHAVVVVEALKTRQMTRSAKGTLDAPGANVKAKSGLNRAILSKGWHQFALALASASRYSGTRVVTVSPQYTSQRCSQCGQVDRNPVRAKRYSGAPTAHIASTRTSTRRNASWPQGLRSPPVKTLPSPRAGLCHRSRNQQETARNYCSNPTPQRDQVGIPRLQPWGGRQLAFNDVTCVGALSAADDRNLSVPEHLSLIGYDDTYLARIRHLSLTSVDNGNFAVGSQAAKFLLQRLDRPDLPQRVYLHPPTVSIRRSTAAPR